MYILPRLLCADKREAHLCLHNLARVGTEVEGSANRPIFVKINFLVQRKRVAAPGLGASGRGVKDDVEVNSVLAALVPSAGVAAHAFRLMVGEQAYLPAQKTLRLRACAFVQAMVNVDGKMRLLRGGKRVTMKTDAARGSQLRADIVARKRRGVVARMVYLVDAGRLDVREIEWSGHRSDENIAILAGSSTEVKMAEAQNAAAAHVAKAGGPAIEAFHIRAELNHAKGHGRADEGIAAPVHAEKGIHIVDVVAHYAGLGLRGLAQEGVLHSCTD